MGSNYWMIHSRDKGHNMINMYYMDPGDVDSRFSRITSDVVVFYGGKDGSGKRIDVQFSNNHFSFKLNIF